MKTLHISKKYHMFAKILLIYNFFVSEERAGSVKNGKRFDKKGESMRLRKWQKIISFIVCLTLILGMSGIQTMTASNILVRAEELGSGEDTEELISGEKTVYSETPADVDTSPVIVDFDAEDNTLADGVSSDEETIPEQEAIPTEEAQEENVESEESEESEEKADMDGVSVVRIEMAKELEKTEAASVAPDENEDAAARSGQTYIVHVQAEDLNTEAKYDSLVNLQLRDFATGLPAGDVKTTAALTGEEIPGTEQADEYVLPGAVQTAEGAKDLVITRVQKTTANEDGTETLAEDALTFILPAGSRADFYLGFTYVTEEESYEKQLMVEATAVQYVPVAEKEQKTQEELSNQSDVPGDGTESDGELLSAETEPDGEDSWEQQILSGSEMLMVGASAYAAGDNPAADPDPTEEPADGNAADTTTDNTEENAADTTTDNTEENTTDTAADNTEETTTDDNGQEETVAVNVLEAQSVPVMMTWSVASAKSAIFFPKTVYFDTCGNGGWNGWNQNSTIYIYLIGNGLNRWETMQKSARINTLDKHTSCGGILWEYTINDTNCTGVIFANQQNFTNDNARQTVDVYFSNTRWASYEKPCFRLTGGAGSDGKKQVECIGDLKPVSQAGKDIYFINMDLDTTLNNVTAVFSGEGIEGSSVPMSGGNGVWKATIPRDTNNTPYSSVQFQGDNSNTLGAKYNFLNTPTEGETGVAYDADTKNTFYYAATEKKDGTKVSVWGSKPSGQESLAGRVLYLDNLHFPVTENEKVYIQVGKGEKAELTRDAEDSNTYSYTIPSDSTATQNTILTVSTSDADYHFLWSDLTSNLLTRSEETAVVSGTYAKKNYIYFDASMSKLSYAGSASADNSLPVNGKQLWFHAWNSSDNNKFQDGIMELLPACTKGGNTWKDVYRGELQQDYDKILFSVGDDKGITYLDNSSQTEDLEIPKDKANPCFYADTSDDAIYNNNTKRSGYWDEVYTIRDAETKKDGKDVVDIKESAFTRQKNVLYVDSTFYDYYTDYELNGNNRDNYAGANGASQRNWVNFRQFDQALSDYYQACNASIPLYTGQFQPPVTGWGVQFKDIASTLNLYGYQDSTASNFFSANNSNFDINGGGDKYDSAAQGLVNSELSGGLPTAKGTGVVLPYFNESFLGGSNSKNAVLGEVYHQVAFPFTKKDIHNDGVEYWYFDSAETTLAMRKDVSGSGYYLQDTGNQGWSQNVNSSGTLDGKDNVSNTYGFFPFNETAPAVSGKNYNYGFGTRLELKFRLTEDGTVLNKNNQKVPIEFQFSGDDDVWVFIDGKLALDVGGDHGRVDGTLNFQDLTASVSKVKASEGSNALLDNQKVDFSINGEKSDEHTLTMFYMERGMWESNMKINFNFPDENQLEVEKQVDKTEVNSLFSGLFDNASLFPFSIKNLATHFGMTTAAGAAASPSAFVVDSTYAYPGNTCERTSFGNETDVVHWYAKEKDITSSYRDRRYGTLTGSTSIDISNMKYLQFRFYYDYPDTPSLSNMYLQLVDSDGKVKGNSSTTDFLSGKTYGTVSMAGNTWITVKLDLDKLQAEDGFNNQVKAIKFGYNYPRDFYLADFSFHPSVEATGLTGFITKQYDIPDYGSAASGQLEIPNGAVYTSSDGKNYAIGSDGTFVLKNRETIIFRDQFRRGSYLSLNELTDPKLFDTSWTMYENGQAVTSMGKGNNVTNGSISNLSNVSGTAVDDGRTENYLTGTEDGQTIQNAYTGAKPSDNTFVFRSYSDPDDTTGATKLKVVFRNRVKTGSLKIKKEKAYNTDNLEGTYNFTVTFTNVGGLGLENTPITVSFSLKEGEEKEITGIPVGTDFKITEEAPTDGSSLEGVDVTFGEASVDPETKIVTGTVDSSETKVFAIFKNTKKPLVNLLLQKVWKNADGTDYNGTLPESIRVQLQRRKTGEADSAYAAVSGYENVVLTAGYEGWIYQFTGLDQYVDYTLDQKVEWIYRVVELDENGTVVQDGGMAGSFRVTGKLQISEELGEAASDKVYILTNTFIPVKLMLKKVKASDPTQMLNGAVFKLEKLKQSDVGKISIGDVSYEIDTGFTSLEKTTEGTTTDPSGNFIPQGQIDFGTIQPGIYQLTETKAPAGFSLLKSPIFIEIHEDGSCTNAQTGERIGTLENSTDARTTTITIANQAKFEIPATGTWSRYIIFFAGVIVAGAAMILYLLQKRRKGDRTL